MILNDFGIQNALANIPEHQRSIFLPQIAQFDMELMPVGFGVMGKARIPEASGWCWAASIDDDRIITMVRLALSEDLPFYEHPQIEYSCIASLSTASVHVIDAIWGHDKQSAGRSRVSREPVDTGCALPSTAPFLEADDEHVMAFTMKPRRYETLLTAGTTHVGVAVHLLPGFFEKLERQCPGELDWLKEAIDGYADVSDSIELRSALRSITQLQANQPGARLHYEAKTLETVSALTRYLSNARQPECGPAGSIGDRVKELLANSLDRPPSLDELASACYTSRTTLCNEFKRATGASIGTYLASLRITRAKKLLETTDEPIASIARRVGYRHASTFSTAFRTACGSTPYAWRHAARTRR